MKKLADNVTATGAQTAQTMNAIAYAAGCQVFGKTSSGTGAATINMEVSNDAVNWLVIATVNLTLGTSSVNDGFAVTGSYLYCRANVTSLTGTGAQVSMWLQE